VIHDIYQLLLTCQLTIYYFGIDSKVYFDQLCCSLLALAGGNRRTADVRCKGYAQLFLLSKVDFEEAMSDYPEAHKLLKYKAKYA